jgi:hypothetical protein
MKQQGRLTSEVQVLPICQITIGGSRQLPLPLLWTHASQHFRLQLIPPHILSLHKNPECDDNDHFDKMAYDHTPNAELVGWTLLSQIEDCLGTPESALFQVREMEGARDFGREGAAEH